MSPRPVAVVCLLLAVSGVVASCQTPASDIGKPCVLVKRDPTDTDPSDGIRSVPVVESEVTEGKDFISFGSTECDDYVCVRDKSLAKSGNPQQQAVGYCSKPCALNSPTSCAVSKDNQAFVSSMACRPLLLDEDTIGAICNVDPVKCRAIFGDNRTPYYCASNGTVSAGDGGTSFGDGGTSSGDGGTP